MHNQHILLLITVLFCLYACGKKEQREKKTLSETSKKEQFYTPGFGEFMSSIQAHHAKLWFSGKAENWELANFELGEIEETLEDIKTVEVDRKETALLGMIAPALDSVRASIENKDTSRFQQAFKGLTRACNACHQAADFGFNVVRIPDKNIFRNQEFQPKR